MATNPSSTCANNGSVNSSTPAADATSTDTSSPSASTRETNSNLSTERITAYISNPNHPTNPAYTHISAAASINKHVNAAITVLNDFDAVMGR
ncbi:hypothetical protein VTL71DRAFT_14734 [Oculimacula yallundae]|uniref:Uncharacterized protein n=1 Tax=Oculimacula yallundae TaxID=86028 RepID=A0ABR4CLL3_9HELO